MATSETYIITKIIPIYPTNGTTGQVSGVVIIKTKITGI
jgi:hypothetical protein